MDMGTGSSSSMSAGMVMGSTTMAMGTATTSMSMVTTGQASSANLPLSDPLCNSETYLTYKIAHLVSQAQISCASQYFYGNWASSYYVVILFLFTLAYAFRLIAYAKPRSSSKQTSVLDKTSAFTLFITYRRIGGLIGAYMGLPSFGVIGFFLLALVFLGILTFFQHPYYRPYRAFGSPPLGVRTGLVSIALTPLIFGLAEKFNLVTLVTGFTGTPPFGLLMFLATFSLPIVRTAFYELFKYFHYAAAVTYLGFMFWNTGNEGNSWCYLIPALGYIKNHPFTISSVPSQTTGISAEHNSLVFLVKPFSGFTAVLHFTSLTLEAPEKSFGVDLGGPYGCIRYKLEHGYDSAILVAGGVGITAVVPCSAATARAPTGSLKFKFFMTADGAEHGEKNSTGSDSEKDATAISDSNVTHDLISGSGVSIDFHRPDLSVLLPSLISVRRTVVIGCGPEAMKIELGNTVARAQKKVLAGETQKIPLHTETFGW
ncbi:hypothetical protein G7Y89_g2795 [Cudoniella acicularis]|uniref:FAD-binding FR-type domain-containing protein n=1 Tax=Cudoniella acicularis TaxID=354080 RepID=A0A8H4W673_9HELO|nr:hypothetical protein G7Y89_g2795 [Cudoniella acicularis]